MADTGMPRRTHADVRIDRQLHPRHGPHDPARSTPPRRPGSVRRTTTHDSLRSSGLTGAVTLIARGRDIRSGQEGESVILATARVDAVVDYMGGRRLMEIHTDPFEPAVQQLVGVSASSGFRAAVLAALPDGQVTHPLRFQLLDDVPTALLVSGYALGAGGVKAHPGGPRLQHPDLCAGWARGGTILAEMDDTGYPPVVTGPEAPSLVSGDDLLGWHELSALPPHGMRRWRRLDVWPDVVGFGVECFFRDSHMSPEGLETVVHEYTVHARVDATTMRFTSSEATVGALPWLECPAAAASAGRLKGAAIDGLRGWVRDTFVGPTTCTHLNDTLRSLEDVAGLVRALG